MAHLSTLEADTSARINQTIDAFFERNIAQAGKVSPFYTLLWQDMHRLIRSGGKRLRPRMVMRSYKAFGGNDCDSILPVAAAQELLHMALLIHDDIIDRDYIRYGVENITGKYEDQHYSGVLDDKDRLHYAQSAALLAGDLLLSGSYQLMLDSHIDPASLLEIQKIHSRSIFEVAGGELLDTESAFRPLDSIDAKTVALYKTASYTFTGPLLIGAILAAAPSKDVAYLKDFAHSLGIAYQLRDDIIGVFGDEKEIGKTTIGDIREGKHTYMVEQFYELAGDGDIVFFKLYFGDKDIQKSEVEAIKELFVSSGALQHTENKIIEYAMSARNALAHISSHTDMNELLELVSIVTERRK